MHPDMRRIILSMPEDICNSDGSTKQDCETNAGKRAVPKLRKDHPQLGLIIVGDDLFSKQPFTETVLNERMHYVLIAKPTDHVAMMNYIHASNKLKEIRISDEKGRIHLYEWTNEVPLNGSKKTVPTNFFRYTIFSVDEAGKKNPFYRESDLQSFETENYL